MTEYPQPNSSPIDENLVSPEQSSAQTSKKSLRYVLFILIGLLVLGGVFFAGVQMGKQDRFQQEPPVESLSATTPPATALPIDTSGDDASTASQFLKKAEPVEEKTEPMRSADLVSTAGWEIRQLGEVSALFPPQVKIREDECSTQGQRFSNFENCYFISGHVEEKTSAMGFRIKTKPYLGGSRRAEAGFNDTDSKYSIVEKMFGNHKALEVIFICEISACTSMRDIVLVVGDQLVMLSDGLYYYPEPDAQYGPRESPVTNTIVSSMKIN